MPRSSGAARTSRWCSTAGGPAPALVGARGAPLGASVRVGGRRAQTALERRRELAPRRPAERRSRAEDAAGGRRAREEEPRRSSPLLRGRQRTSRVARRVAAADALDSTASRRRQRRLKTEPNQREGRVETRLAGPKAPRCGRDARRSGERSRAPAPHAAAQFSRLSVRHASLRRDPQYPTTSGPSSTSPRRSTRSSPASPRSTPRSTTCSRTARASRCCRRWAAGSTCSSTAG